MWERVPEKPTGKERASAENRQERRERPPKTDRK